MEPANPKPRDPVQSFNVLVDFLLSLPQTHRNALREALKLVASQEDLEEWWRKYSRENKLRMIPLPNVIF